MNPVKDRYARAVLRPSPSGASDVTATYPAIARNPENIISGAVTRNEDGVVVSAQVRWPDGATGVYNAVVNSTLAGVVDGYTITHVLAGVTKIYTQPTVTRDANGTPTNVPQIQVS